MVSTDSKEFWLESIGTLKSISTVLTDGCLDPFELSGMSDNPWICRLSVKNERFHGFGHDL